MDFTVPIQPQQKAGRREWTGLIILVLPTLLVSTDMTVTYLALPALSAALKPTGTQLLWITDIYGFLNAGVLIVMGTLGDRVGTHKLLLAGAFVFAAASTMAAFSTSAIMLILARAVLGIAGATLLTSVISLIRNMFHNDAERTVAMGLYTTCFSTGTMVGPLVGGLLLSRFWWGSVFLIALPIMALLLVGAPTLLPKVPPRKTAKIDVGDAALLVTAMLAVTFGIKQLAQDGFGILALVFVVFGATTAIIFYRRQKILPHPLVDLQLFRQPSFNLALLALLTALFSWSGISLFVAQYLQLIAGLDTLQTGFWMMPGAAGSIVACMLAPMAVRRFERGRLMAAGLAALATGIALLGFLSGQSLPVLVAGTVIMTSGCGLTVTLGIDMVLSAAPPEKAGSAAGISETSTALGGSFGVAVLGSVWTAFYRTGVNKVMPAGIDRNDAETIRGALGGALSVAGKFNGVAKDVLIAGAREAFMHSLHITTLVCALIVYLVAIIVEFRLRQAG